MTIRALFFAHYQDIVGRREIAVTVPAGTTLRELAALLARDYPALGGLLTAGRAAVNADFAAPGDILTDNAEVAFLPPVSGGC